MGFTVVVEDLRESGAAAHRVAETARGVDPVAALAGVLAGMPGSRAAASARAVGATWRHEVDLRAVVTTTYGDDLIAAADRYAADDSAAAAELRSLTPVDGPVAV